MSDARAEPWRNPFVCPKCMNYYDTPFHEYSCDRIEAQRLSVPQDGQQ